MAVPVVLKYNSESLVLLLKVNVRKHHSFENNINSYICIQQNRLYYFHFFDAVLAAKGSKYPELIFIMQYFAEYQNLPNLPVKSSTF